MRALTRYRKTQIAERQREANRLHKALEDTNIKLDCVATDILGVSGRAMLDALVAGTTDPEVLADLARGRLRQKLPALREALEGRFDRLHALLIGSILAHLDFLDEQIDGLSHAIEEQLAPFGIAAVALLVTIPGVGERSAQNILAEIGPTCRSSRPTSTWHPGPVSARATTSQPANSAPARLAKARDGSTRRSRNPRWRRPGPRTPTSKRSTNACARGSDMAARSAPSKHAILQTIWHMLSTGETYRKTLIYERSRAVNRLHKLLEDAGVKLSCVATDVMGVSGRALMRALIEGDADAQALAELAKGKLRKKLPALRKALEGRFRAHHTFLLERMLAHIEDLEDDIKATSARVEEQIGPFESAVALLRTIPGG